METVPQPSGTSYRRLSRYISVDLSGRRCEPRMRERSGPRGDGEGDVLEHRRVVVVGKGHVVERDVRSRSGVQGCRGGPPPRREDMM